MMSVTDAELIKSVGAPEGSQVIDEGAIVFIVEPSGKVHEQWFLSVCNHAVDVPDCPECQAEEVARNEARKRFQASH